jgi:hypothetical protein
MKINGATLTGSTKVSLFKGRHKYIYGVNGGGRGIRWSGSGEAEYIGMQAPTAALTMTTTASTANIVAAVEVIASGGGYYQPPTVTFSGGGLTSGDTRHAQGLARLKNGGVANVVITNAGRDYTSRPQVAISGGRGSGATVSVGVDGGVAAVIPTNAGSGYTNGATISFFGNTGFTGAIGEVDITDGRVSGVRVINPGSGATAAATATIYAVSGGTSAAVKCVMSYSVTALTVTGGTGFAGTVPVQFSSISGSGAAAYCIANETGAPTNPVITSRGAYAVIPTASVLGTAARAEALIRAPMRGSYRCGYRYIDNTLIADGGPVPSSLSELVTVEAASGASAFVWNWSNSGADSRVAAVELWRTSANQAVVLYRIALLEKSGGVLPSTYTDTMDEATLIDSTRSGYALMPITLPSGQLNAYRFVVPPTDMEDACWFQDRAWYGANTNGTRPNSLLFSEVDEPESVPDVNEVVIQNNTGSQDKVIALIPYGAMMLVAQERHMYRLTYVAQPVIDAAITLAGYRGLLNKRCWATFEGGLYCVDSFGMYGFDGSSMEPLSAAVDDYWRDGVIDFSKSANFFVQADPPARVIRFHYCKSTDGVIPPRALCYCLATKTWWEEVYPQGVGASTIIRVNGKQSLVCGSSDGKLLAANSGLVDSSGNTTASIPYELRTGPMTITDEPTRQIGVLYKPTATTSDLTLRVHYNNSPTYRQNAVNSDRGEGVVASPTGVVIDMRTARSALGDSTGYSTARYSGRANDRSAGADRHLAVNLSGSQSGSPIVLHGVTIGGVTA